MGAPGRTLTLVLVASGSIACAAAGQWLLLTTLGAGRETDVYFATMAVPQVLLAIAASPLVNALVPVLVLQTPQQRQSSFWSLYAVLGAAVAALLGLLGLTLPLWLPLIMPGFSGAGADLAIVLAEIQLLGLLVAFGNLVLISAAQAQGRFVRIESATLVGSLAGLAAMSLTLPVLGIVAAAWAGVIRVLVQAAIMLPMNGRPTFADEALMRARDLLARMKPLLVSGAVVRTDPLVDRALLSLATSGMLSLFQMAMFLYGAVIEIAYRAWLAPMMPTLVRSVSIGQDAVSAHLRSALRQSLLVALVVIVLLVFAGMPLLRVVMGYGHVAATDVSNLWWMLLGLAGVPLGACVGQLAASAFYARGDTATPAHWSLWSFACFVPLKIGGFFTAGVAGLVMVGSVYYLVNALLLWRVVMRLDRSTGGQ